MRTKPVGIVLNKVGDLLPIQGQFSSYPPEDAKRLLFDACSKCKENGVVASAELKAEISNLIAVLEASNPTRSPSRSKLMSGFWKLLYTSSPPSQNTGKIGPFVGDVYQDLTPEVGIIKNICSVKFPPIGGALAANQTIFDAQNWY